MFIGRIDLLKSLIKQSNLFLPFGKVRMGLRSGWVILWEGQDGLSFGKVRMGYPWGRLGWVILWGRSGWIKLNLCLFNYFVYFCIPIILYTYTPYYI
jgi:hypothetical protein